MKKYLIINNTLSQHVVRWLLEINLILSYLKTISIRPILLAGGPARCVRCHYWLQHHTATSGSNCQHFSVLYFICQSTYSELVTCSAICNASQKYYPTPRTKHIQWLLQSSNWLYFMETKVSLLPSPKPVNVLLAHYFIRQISLVTCCRIVYRVTDPAHERRRSSSKRQTACQTKWRPCICLSASECLQNFD
jgi:hypothetical protein